MIVGKINTGCSPIIYHISCNRLGKGSNSYIIIYTKVSLEVDLLARDRHCNKEKSVCGIVSPKTFYQPISSQFYKILQQTDEQKINPAYSLGHGHDISVISGGQKTSGRGVQHYVIKVVSDLWQVGRLVYI
jgi:hypothetical protein